jgi:hypothetical protein
MREFWPVLDVTIGSSTSRFRRFSLFAISVDFDARMNSGLMGEGVLGQGISRYGITEFKGRTGGGRGRRPPDPLRTAKAGWMDQLAYNIGPVPIGTACGTLTPPRLRENMPRARGPTTNGTWDYTLKSVPADDRNTRGHRQPAQTRERVLPDLRHSRWKSHLLQPLAVHERVVPDLSHARRNDDSSQARAMREHATHELGHLRVESRVIQQSTLEERAVL